MMLPPDHSAETGEIAFGAVEPNTKIVADETPHWDLLPSTFDLERVNHSDAYSFLDGVHITLSSRGDCLVICSPNVSPCWRAFPAAGLSVLWTPARPHQEVSPASAASLVQPGDAPPLGRVRHVGGAEMQKADVIISGEFSMKVERAKRLAARRDRDDGNA